jgi:uncharacterized protein YndB with AHSA1/START domain
MYLMQILISAIVLLGIGIVVAVFWVPKLVNYFERIDVHAPVSLVYDAIRHQEQLMRWSAWPSATNSTCACEGEDGTVGAKTVFFSKGKRFGYQVVSALNANQSVSLRLSSAGPPQDPTLTFVLEPTSPQTTRVHLLFENQIARPFQVLLRVFGIVRWTRSMHRKDLEGLKRFCEAASR